MKVGIIGAGMAGLSCAEVLFRHGIEVEIFDENTHTGGRCCTIHKQGFTLDIGAQFFFGNYHRTRELAQRLGLESSCQNFNAPYGYLKRGRIFDFSPYITAGKLGSGRFLGTGDISWSQKIKMGAFFLWIFLNTSKLDFQTNAETNDFNYISFADFILEKWGPDLYEDLISPLLFSWILEDPKNISAQTGLMFFRYLMTGVWTMMGGIGYLPRKLALKLKKVRLNKHVDQIDLKRKRVDLSVDGKQKSFDSVVIATDAVNAAELIKGCDAETVLKKIRYSMATIVIHALETRPEKIANRWAILGPEKKGHPYISVTNSAVKFIGNVPPRATALNWFLAGEKAKEYIHESDRNLLKMIEHEAHGIFMDYSHPLFTQIVRWKRALVNPSLEQLAEIKKIPVEVEPNLYLAGSYFHAFGVEGAVYSGREAAFRIIRKMDREK